VLVSNPDFRKMNAVRWQFEYLAMIRKRKQDMADLAFLLVGDTFQELDIDKQLVIVPLGYIVSPERMDKLKQHKDEEELREKEGTFMNDEEYEAMLKEMESKGHVLDDLEELSVANDNRETKK